MIQIGAAVSNNVGPPRKTGERCSRGDRSGGNLHRTTASVSNARRPRIAVNDRASFAGSNLSALRLNEGMQLSRTAVSRRSDPSLAGKAHRSNDRVPGVVEGNAEGISSIANFQLPIGNWRLAIENPI
jgi:hypothetical protein